ncbi:MAG: hypothetical protein EXX96DRAFT_481510 [Benjaminiella poitrasii]|nr:MAG: hypothetical protein EXX96DRAFT_493224 [Benjaminiella poitrasii]KAI9481019.1 MAG: hypothetical protein EXX96DRAFT_481510 [Benjaminiella poitrasii]
MPYIERSRTLRWCLDWLPGGRPQPCLYHPNAHLLNMLPTTKPSQYSEATFWFVRWPIIYTILHELTTFSTISFLRLSPIQDASF